MCLPTQPSSNLMHSLKQIYQLVRNFLFGWMHKEFLIFLFFLALSGIFWLMMTLNETYEKEFPVAVRLVGAPKNVVMTSSMSDTVRVTVRDKGFMLLSYSMSDGLHPVQLNFNTYANKQTGHGQVPVGDLQKYVRQQLSASSTLTGLKADRLEFYFNYGRNKEVKVRLSGHIVPAKNYYLAHVQFWPERVTVYASKSKLDSLENVLTEYLDIVNFEDTVVCEVRLKSMPGVKIVPQSVKLALYPDILTEESIEVPITTINKPDDLVVRTFPQRVKVSFTVGASMYRLIKATDFQVVVDYREVAAHPSDKCKLYLRAKPQGVNSARLEVQQVDYLIEHQ